MIYIRFLGNKMDKKYILDLTSLRSDLGKIECNDQVIKVGSLVTHTELSENNLIIEKAGILAKSALVVGSSQMRNMGTIGGNVVNASLAGDTLPALAA